MKKAKKPSARATFKEEPKPIESSEDRVFLFQKTPTFYHVLPETLIKLRKTRHIKYVSKLTCSQDRNLPSKLKNLKKLDNLVIQRERSMSRDQVIVPLKFIKAFNPFKKHVQLFHEDYYRLHPSLFAHIHNLYRLNLMQHHSLLKRKVRFITKVKYINFIIDSYSIIHFFSKDEKRLSYFARLMRLTASFGCLGGIRIQSQINTDLIPKLFTKLKALPSLCSSLKKFHIEIESSRLSVIQEVSPYVTKLHTVFVPFDIETVKSLSRLEYLKFRVIQDQHNLSLLENFPKLKKVKIDVDMHDKAVFESFLEKFNAPSCLETLKLNFNRMTLRHIVSKTPLRSYKNFPHFIKQITCLNQLKRLCFTTQDETHGSEFITDFATSLLKQVQSLESLSLINTASGRPGAKGCLDLYSIVNGINKLKLPIQNITIKDLRIAQKGFDQALELFKRGTQKITIEGLRVDSTGNLSEVLEQLPQVPENRTLNLHVNVEKVDGDGFAEEILTFLKKDRLKGDVYLYFYDLAKQMKAKYEKQLNKRVTENKIPVSKVLKVTTKRGHVILDLKK